MTEYYPTDAHAKAANGIVEYFEGQKHAEAVLLVNSCARGKATPDSCLDIVVFVATVDHVGATESEWNAFYQRNTIFRRLEAAGRFAEVHLDVVTGDYQPGDRTWTGGPDDFELQIGNHLAYSAILWERNDKVERLRALWLPFYDEQLRNDRLAMVRKYCLNNLEHIPLYLPRGLYFQSFARLYNATKEFLQALFISRRTYPIAYDKWIKEQVVDILGLPDAYATLTTLLEIQHFESDEIGEKAGMLRELLDTYAVQ
jgi:hypothetical protein